MSENKVRAGAIKPIIISIFILISSTFSFAGAEKGLYNYSEKRINLALTGGYAHSESIGGMANLNLAIQFSLSSHVKVGLGVGYLGGNDDVHMNGNFGNTSEGMMGGMGGEMMGGFSGHNHKFKTIPITLSLYYVLPINLKFDVFMLGGGGYYIGSYRDQSSQNKSSFGPHVGAGLGYKISDRVVIVAQGLYRFVSLKGFMSELHQGFREGMDGEEHEQGFWHFHHHSEEWHFHNEHESRQQMFEDVPPFDVSLDGLSFRIGIKFLF